MGKRAKQTKADQRVREAQIAVLANAVALVHEDERRIQQAARGVVVSHLRHWALWEELRSRVMALDMALAEKEARNG